MQIWPLFLAFSLAALTAYGNSDWPCAVLLDHLAHLTKLNLGTENREKVSQIELVSGNRVAVGTAILAPSDTLVVGGRLIIQDLGEVQNDISLELPTLSGKPTSVKAMRASPDGQSIAATGGYLLGGPVLVYEVSSHPTLAHASQEKRKAGDWIYQAFLEIFERNLAGDPQAQNSLARLLPESAELVSLYANDPVEARQLLRALTKRMMGVRGQWKSEPIPAIDMQFHPTKNHYLVSAGNHSSIRDNRSGREIARVPNYSFISQSPPHRDSPHSYFLGAGDYVANVFRNGISLFSAETGYFIDEVKHLRQYDFAHIYPAVVPAPKGDFISIAYREPRLGNCRTLWGATKSSDGRVRLEMVKAISGGGNSRMPIGFSQSDIYVVGMPRGEVNFYSSLTHDLTDHFSIGANHAVYDVALSPQGQFVAVAAKGKNSNFLEVRSISNKIGARIELPKYPGKWATIWHIRFSPDGSKLVFTLGITSEQSVDQDYDVHVYSMDVYRTLSAVK